MAGFRINYPRVISQANSMNNLSYELGREIQQLEGILADVKANWAGPASQAYQKQLLMLIADMKSTKFKISSVSSTIKNVANRIQREDERLAELSKIL